MGILVNRRRGYLRGEHIPQLVTYDIDISSSFTFTDVKGVLISNGKLSSNSTYDQYYAHSNIVELPEGAKSIKVRLPRKPQASSNIGCAVYSANGGYAQTYHLGGVRHTSSGSPTAVASNEYMYTLVFEYTLPEGSKFIATSWFSTTCIGTKNIMPFSCIVTVERYE